jgi:succinate dehydrogenase / fumarate reductase membrane anchor subunit
VRDQGLWTWHLVAGVVILVLLGLHMTIMHLDEIVRVFNAAPGEPIDWANVTARGKSAFFLVNYVLLLGAALFHGLYGLRNILFELNPAAGLRKALNGLFVVAGLALFAFGAWAAWAGLTVARGA